MANKLAKRPVASGPVDYKIHGPQEKPTGILVSINYEEAPVPSHYYVANWFDVQLRDIEIVLSFGDSDGANLRSRIDITFPALVFLRQLWGSSREFHSTLQNFVTAFGLQARGTTPAVLVSDKLQALVSNNALMVLSGTETLLDFFYISPKDMWSKPRRGEKLELEPVVRVICSPTLLLGLLNACTPIVDILGERFKSFLKKEEEGLDEEDMES